MSKKTKVSGFFLTLFTPTLFRLFALGSEGLRKVLDKAIIKKPGLVREAVMAVYPFIDVFLEDYVLETPNKVDDKGVAELKKTIEEFAAANDITLENLDDD